MQLNYRPHLSCKLLRLDIKYGIFRLFPCKSAIKSVYFHRMTDNEGMATVKKIKTFKRIHYLSFKIRQSIIQAIYKFFQ